MRHAIAAMLLTLALPAGATAQELTSSAVTVPLVIPGKGQGVLPINTEVILTLDEDLSSKTVKQGSSFALTVSRDVQIGNYVVIPRGTPGHGEVTYRTGKGAFGKSGKMQVALRSITLGGREIPIAGGFREEGEGGTREAVAVSFFSPLVTGRSVLLPKGREFHALTREALLVAFPPVATRLAPSPN
jgi:hypothetical protein